MRHLLAIILLGAAGCLVPASLDAQPLRADVWFDEYTGLASFDLNRPAHVAIFALRPLGSIELIYPGWGWGQGIERPFRTGRHSVRIESRMYQLVRGRSGHGYSRYGTSRHRTSGQTYILLIASDRPLYLDGFLTHGTLSWLNHPSVTWNPFLATDQLAREIVPGQGRSEWTAAYHVIWPEAALRRYDGRIPVTRVRCPGGVIAIHTQVLRSGAWACPDRHARPPEAARPRSPRVPAVTDVLPKRPRPTDWGRATPVRPGRGSDADGRRVRPRPDAKPGEASRPATVTNVIPRPRPAPVVRPKPAAPNVRPKPGPKPTVRPSPPVRPKPAAKPKVRPKPVPKPKPKKKGGG